MPLKEKNPSLKKHTHPISREKLTVIKREGNIVPFNPSRIERAIGYAFHNVHNIPIDEKTPQEIHKIVQSITDTVVEKLYVLGEKGVSLTVEGIQDVVEVTLMKHGYHDVARHYIVYRDHQEQSRKSQPRNIFLLRKDGSTTVRFNPIKVSSTIAKVFQETLHLTKEQTLETVIDSINALTQKVIDSVKEQSLTQEALTISLLQDIIENVLMQNGFFDQAKYYILDRSKKDEKVILHESAKPQKETEPSEAKNYTVIDTDGSSKRISNTVIRQKITYACRDLEDLVSVDDLVHATLLNFYEGMKIDEVDTALIMAARAKVEVDPAYAQVTARLLLDKLYRESMQISALDPDLKEHHQKYFSQYIKQGISLKRLSPLLLDFDLEKLSQALDLDRDNLFQYIGLQTLYDRYFIHDEGRRLETPQIFWMRVCMGLSIQEENKTEKAIEFYQILSQFLYSPGTPTLFNSGTNHSQLSSCYLSTVEDDLAHIFKVISDDAQLSKWAGGLGNDWTNVRATGSNIQGTNGKSQGVIPFLKVANDTAVAVNQGGKRKGALCSYLETWHLDIEDFIELRKNTGDDRRRTHDMNTANWIPDLFLKRVEAQSHWTLFTPSDTPDLHDLYGHAFEKRYVEYENMAKDGKIKVFKQIDALTLWRKMLGMLFETGHPWITFKDPSNIRSPQDHVGVVHSSNLCTEILLNTSRDEVAVCNLGSVNLVRHFKDGKLQEDKLAKTVKTAVRMLDNVIDINFYPIPEAKNANLRHRSIGLGLMGFQDILYMKGISYASHEAVELADTTMEMISYHAILASSELAKERGTYSSYKGSKWDRGLLPIDTIDLLEKERGEKVEMDRSTRLDWSVVRNSVKKHGMRNSNTMAIAPTATIANILGVTASIEPTYKNLFVKSNLSGEFTIPNIYLIEALKKANLWNPDILDDIKYYDGSIQEISEIPEEIKSVFVTAFEIDPDWLIECGSRRQKWIDMGQSLNLYLAQVSGKKLHDMYIRSWKKGIKTNYYLRSLGATQIEKSTLDINKEGRSLQPRWMKNTSATQNVQVVRNAACSLEEGCESCQ